MMNEWMKWKRYYLIKCGFFWSAKDGVVIGSACVMMKKIEIIDSVR